MTKFYFLNFSDDPKVTGVRGDYTPAWLIGKDAPEGNRFEKFGAHILEAMWRGEQTFPSHNEFPTFSFQLKKSAKPVSFLKFGPHFPTGEFLIDDKARSVFERLRIQEHRIYPVSVSDGLEWLKYWMFLIHQIPYAAIDFGRSIFYLEAPFEEGGELRFGSFEEFMSSDICLEKDLWRLHVHTLALNSFVDRSLNLFCTPFGGRLVISELMAKELEDAGCVGHSFSPIESQEFNDLLLFKWPGI